MTDKNREKIFSILSASRQQSLRRNPLYGIVDNPLPTPAWQGVQDIPLDEFMDAPLAESRARQDAQRLEAEREISRRLMPMGMGTLTDPFVNTILEPERRESVARNVDGALDWLGDVGSDIAGYVGSGRAGRDASRVAEQAPEAIARLPGAVSGVARQAPGAVERLGGAIGQGYDWVSNQADPEMFDEPSFIGGVGSLAVEHGPDILRGLTYGPWENERRLQGDIDLQEARRARGLPVDEGALDSTADQANLETVFAGLNAGFAPADVPAAVGAAGRVARETGETVSQAGRAVSDVINSNAVLRDYVVPWNQGWWGGRAVGVAGGGAAGAMLSDAEDLQGRLTDAGVGAGVGWFAGAPIGALAMTAPRAIQDISRLGDDVIRALPWEEPPIRDVEFSVAPAGAEPELRARQDGELGAEVNQRLRSLRTPQERAAWANEAVIRLPADESGDYDIYGFRGPSGGEFVVKFDDVQSGARPFTAVSFEDMARSNAFEPYDAQNRFSPSEARQILNRVVATIEEDAAAAGRGEYQIRPQSPQHARAYAAMMRSMEPPPGYRISAEGVDPNTPEVIRILRDDGAPSPVGARLPSVPDNATLPEAIRSMPLLSAPVLAAGATGATAGALLTPQDAEASDGGEGDGMEAPMLPILGGIGAATIAALARGRPIARELNSQTGMFAGINARTADRAALARAQEMTAQGASRDDIWRDTGWFQGVDGKWRFEIDDSGARLSSRAQEGFESGKPYYTNLSGGFEHPSVYDAYSETRPFMGDYDLMRTKKGVHGSYRGQTDRVEALAPTVDDARSITLHEIQHGVQEREGFARGGVPENMLQDELKALNNRLSRIVTEQDHWRSYARNGPEFKAEADQNLAALRDEYNELLERRAREMGPEAQREAYRRLGGETEARNVQTRRDFTPEERRARPPWETQDVPDDQQIIRFDGNRAESASPLRGVGLSRDRMVAAIRDPETGRIFSGANHADAIAEAPEAIQPRLEALYARDPNGADVGFMRGEEFFTRDEALSALGDAAFGRAHPPRLGSNADSGVNEIPQPRATRSGTEADFPALRGTGNVREPERFYDERLTDQQNRVARWAMTGRNAAQIADELAKEGADTITAPHVRVVINAIQRRAPDVYERIGRGWSGNTKAGPSIADRVLAAANELAAEGVSGKSSGHIELIAERLGLTTQQVRDNLNRARRLQRRQGGADPLAGVGLAALAGGGAALAAGEADAQEMTADGRAILPRPEGVDWSQGQWQGPWQRVGSLEDGTPTVRRLQVMPDGSEYYVVGVQGADGIRYLGYLEPTEGAPGPAPDPFSGTGSREPNYTIGDPGDRSGEEEEPQSGNGLGTAERIALGLGAGLMGRFGSRALGAGRIESELLGFGAGAGGNLLAGGDALEALGAGAGTVLSGIGADELLNYSPRLRVGEDFADRARQFALTLPDEAPRERVLRLDRQTGDVMASDGGAERLSPRSEFLASPLEDQIAWMRREGVPVEAMADQSLPFGLDDVPLVGRLRGAEDVSPDAWVWDDVTRAGRRGPDAPAPDPERVMRGLEVQRMVRDTPQGPATAPIGFFDPDTGKPLFGVEPKPRRQTQRPPLEERATERGAVGALQGVNASTLRRIASDLDLETQGVGVADLRRTLAKNLGRNFDSTRELVAFLERYGVTGLTIGAIGAGAASGALDPIDGVGL